MLPCEIVSQYTFTLNLTSTCLFESMAMFSGLIPRPSLYFLRDPSKSRDWKSRLPSFFNSFDKDSVVSESLTTILFFSVSGNAAVAWAAGVRARAGPGSKAGWAPARRRRDGPAHWAGPGPGSSGSPSHLKGGRRRLVRRRVRVGTEARPPASLSVTAWACDAESARTRRRLVRVGTDSEAGARRRI